MRIERESHGKRKIFMCVCVCYYFDGVERKGDLGGTYMIGMGRNC